MTNKVVTIIIAAAVAILVGAGGFLLGMRMGGAQSASQPGGGRFGGGPGMPGGGPGGGGPGGPGPGGPQGGFRQGPGGRGFVAGKVLSKDKGSITVSLPQGGSKIVYLSGSTRFESMSSGSAADVSVGETVTAVGNADSSGGITARNVTIVKR